MRFYEVIFLKGREPVKSIITYGKCKEEAYIRAENIYSANKWNFKYNDMRIGERI